ncbi:MAG: Gldg family protein [Alphaproteobacteria bacterium]|nr:Gldg family protein [Alphaproteobacteria bacterium]
MGAILSIAEKEVRALFQSQIAILFLALFEISTLFSFFVLSAFFARNLADMRPFFEWLPLQLILLVSAISMRSWAEERKSGTLEILLTLPVRTADLVLGKFTAGMVLVGLALLFTLPLPLTVWSLGPLDWGPVIGGYLGALLLASAYLAIGLCVSARTDNQVLALMATMAIGGALYLVGTENIQALLGTRFGAVASLLGSGSRFESIARGVVDLRDLVYYASITAFFLVLNGYFLDRQRIDAAGAGRSRLFTLQGIVGLALLNAVVANLWVTPVRVARVDLTQNADYTISDVTRRILADLDEPLVIQGIFSERSHPKLQPRVPQLKALLEEYGIVGGEKVRVEFLDPSGDDDLADQLDTEYGIRAVPMPTRDRNEARIVNAWFHVLLRYGDQHAVVGFDELVEVDVSSGEPEVRLRDPEYDITKAIRKVSQEFVSTASLVTKLPEGSKLTLYATPAAFASESGAEMQANLEAMREVATNLAAMSDKLTFEEVDPSADRALAEQIARDYGVQPALSLQLGQVYYLHLVFTSGDNAQRIFPRGALSKSELESTLDSVLKRAVPGQLKTVAVLTEIPLPPPQDPRNPTPPPPPQPDYRLLQQRLASRFEVKQDVDLSGGSVPDDVDVLIVGKAGKLSPTQQLAIDTFLMRGGSVVALAGRNRIEFGRAGFAAQPEDDSLFQMLEHWGVKVGSEIVADKRMSKLALPVGRRTVEFDYPFWPEIRPDTMNEEHLALSRLPHLSAPWASPLTIGTVPDGLTEQTLFSSTSDAWLPEPGGLMPDFRAFGSTVVPGFANPTNTGTQVLGVTLTGRFPSFFTDETRPEVPGALTTPVADGKLVVLGSSEMLSDVILDFSRSPAGLTHANNIVLLQNLVDWSLEDTDLLTIRNPGNFSRTLYPTDPDQLFRYELANYVLVLLPLPLLYFWSRRRRTPNLARKAA